MLFLLYCLDFAEHAKPSSLIFAVFLISGSSGCILDNLTPVSTIGFVAVELNATSLCCCVSVIFGFDMIPQMSDIIINIRFGRFTASRFGLKKSHTKILSLDNVTAVQFHDFIWL